MSHRFKLVETFGAVRQLARIRVPTLALAGARDLLVSEKSLAELTSGIGNCKAVTLPGCGHLAFVTRPECVAAEVTRFLTDKRN
jgi:pimeloyl-ACP methyl ester carboxylesterase